MIIRDPDPWMTFYNKRLHINVVKFVILVICLIRSLFQVDITTITSFTWRTLMNIASDCCYLHLCRSSPMFENIYATKPIITCSYRGASCLHIRRLTFHPHFNFSNFLIICMYKLALFVTTDYTIKNIFLPIFRQ